jgi:hypothetical protein
MKSLAPILVLLLVVPPVQSVSGTVRSTEGRGLAGIFIFFGGIADIAETSGDGTFSLPRHLSYIAFFGDGYRPVIKRVESGSEPLDIVLESSRSTEWIVPPCKSLKNPGKRIGFLLQFPVPGSAKTEHGTDVDYSTFGLGIRQGKRLSWIEGGVGRTWAAAGPREDLLNTASEFTVRSYGAGTWNGFDVKGQSSKGEYWRYLGWVGESVNYRVESKEVATTLDRIIDDACY